MKTLEEMPINGHAIATQRGKVIWTNTESGDCPPDIALLPVKYMYVVDGSFVFELGDTMDTSAREGNITINDITFVYSDAIAILEGQCVWTTLEGYDCPPDVATLPIDYIEIVNGGIVFYLKRS